MQSKATGQPTDIKLKSGKTLFLQEVHEDGLFGV